MSNKQRRKGHLLEQLTVKDLRDLFPKDIPIDPAPIIVIILCLMLMYLF